MTNDERNKGVMDVETLQRALDELDDGVLFYGSHRADEPKFCALELSAVVRGQHKHDRPGDLPDLRPLNDALWSSDALRTQYMLPVIAAYWDWAQWDEDRRRRVAERVVILTVQRIISALPNLPENIATECRKAQTLEQCKAAAEAAWAARAAAEAAEAARAAGAARAAAEAAEAAEAVVRAAAEADAVLITACQLWVEATEA